LRRCDAVPGPGALDDEQDDRAEAGERAREYAIRARTEARRREVAEQLASETAERAAAANAARVEAEEAALRATLEREAAEARARAQAEAAERALAERSAAEVRAQELAASLEETRAALVEQTKATLAAQQAQASAPAPAPAPAHAPPPDPKVRPAGVPDLVEFRSPSSSAVITVLVGLGALVAAAATVYEAYLDRLTTLSGLTASAVTLLLVIVVGRSRGSVGQVWLDHGVLHVEEGDSHRRFDLTTPSTEVEMVGRPGSRRWKVLFLRKGMAPYEVNADLVDPEQFVAALEPWRPKLGGR